VDKNVLQLSLKSRAHLCYMGHLETLQSLASFVSLFFLDKACLRPEGEIDVLSLGIQSSSGDVMMNRSDQCNARSAVWCWLQWAN
jgi:hypothetical protein